MAEKKPPEADETAESVAAKIAKALLGLPAPETKRRKQRARRTKRAGS